MYLKHCYIITNDYWAILEKSKTGGSKNIHGCFRLVILTLWKSGESIYLSIYLSIYDIYIYICYIYVIFILYDIILYYIIYVLYYVYYILLTLFDHFEGGREEQSLVEKMVQRWEGPIKERFDLTNKENIKKTKEVVTPSLDNVKLCLSKYYIDRSQGRRKHWFKIGKKWF